MIRAFIAVDLPQEIKDGIISAAKGIKAGGIKAVSADQIHITLFFLGYLDKEQIERAKDVISTLNCKKFEVSLTGVGTFDPKRPRVIFAKIDKGAEELNDIYKMMLERLSEIAKLDERGFSPHVTIARLKEFDRGTVDAARDFIDKHEEQEFGSFTCSGIRLKQSVLTKDGAIHSDLYVKELD